ncbi:DUF3866 family protein [Paenibacillus rigui]|uniref:DUF3866 domain-containing protein n=1 Tax=Paenibacillus rigui TaxID=554312 RepID=A0A229UYG1_9BACL|nr:DUF3866 family protein [Paenibacillus rigui]OXM88145.1 hypothetical protein CF651_03390 [Paenibacillus rigui]
MMRWSIGIVTEAAEPEQGVQETLVELADGSNGKAIYYCEEGMKASLSPGDQVLVNTTAASLRLGTGGYHFIHSIIPSSNSASPVSYAEYDIRDENTSGHIMKMRYTPLQRSVLAAEEAASDYHPLFLEHLSLEGLPVLIGELHSMLPAVLCRLRQLEQKQGKKCKVAYIMTDGAALPLSFSRHVRLLKRLDWLAGTVTYGHAYGGDLETVNKYTALLAAKHVLQADIAVVLMGPGSVGTGTLLGFSGIETGELINAAAALHGKPILIPRMSFTDLRERHQGLSHHALTVLSKVALAEACVPLPKLSGVWMQRLHKQICEAGIEARHQLRWHEPLKAEEWDQALAAYPEPIYSMGRELHEDPCCLAGIGAAADEAWNAWQSLCHEG